MKQLWNLLAFLFVVRHYWYPISVNICLLIARSQHLAYFAEFISLKLLWVSLLGDPQFLQQNNTVCVIRNFQTVGNLDYSTTWIILLQEFDNWPSSNKWRSILYDNYFRLWNQNTKHSYLLPKASSEVFIYFLNVWIQSFLVEFLKIFSYS